MSRRTASRLLVRTTESIIERGRTWSGYAWLGRSAHRGLGDGLLARSSSHNRRRDARGCVQSNESQRDALRRQIFAGDSLGQHIMLLGADLERHTTAGWDVVV